MGVDCTSPDVTSAAIGALPELASVHWRPRVSQTSLRRVGRLWTLTTIVQTVLFLAAAVPLLIISPLTMPLGALVLVHAWLVPELYASRGAKVLRTGIPATGRAEGTAVGLLGDLVDHSSRELLARTRLVLERGALGAWLLGERGAVLVRPGGHRMHCYCVKVSDPDLPSGDRIAHLLLALRADEAGFATVANLAFSGARWRLRRRLPKPARAGLDSAVAAARTM